MQHNLIKKEYSSLQKKQGTLIKKTAIPLHLQFSKHIRMEKQQKVERIREEQGAKQTLGIVNFPTQQYKMKLGKVQINSQIHKEPISYKNLNYTNEADQENKKEKYQFSKRTIEYNKVTIKPQKLKKKQFVINIPIKVSKTGVVRRQNERQHFVLEFTNKEGRLTLVSDFQEANTEIIIPGGRRQRTIQEEVELQKQILDARRQTPGFQKDNNQQEERPELPSIDEF